MTPSPTVLPMPNESIINRVGCVECDARQGEPCHSRFLDKPMVNEVHRTRRADAAKVQPARGRK